MPAGRFIMDRTALGADRDLELDSDIAHQVRDVLRLSTGDTLRLLDGEGLEYRAVVTAMDRKRVLVRTTQPVPGIARPAVRVVLCQGMLKSARYEWILQKGTELGVCEFIPMQCQRSVSASEEASDSKMRRWTKITREAVEQSGGSYLPTLREPQPFAAAISDMQPGTIAIIPWEGTRERPLSTTVREQVRDAGGLTRVAEIRLFIGPEGGFTPAEIDLSRQAGVIPVTLGARILRAETAAIVAAALALDAAQALDHGPRPGS